MRYSRGGAVALIGAVVGRQVQAASPEGSVIAGKHTFLLDGDNLRLGPNPDLGFTDSDRVENIRRVGEAPDTGIARLLG